MTNQSSEHTQALVGQRILRTEDQTLLRGRGRFVDDMPTYRNRCTPHLFALLIRTHALITSTFRTP